MSDLSWIKKLIIGGKITIYYVILVYLQGILCARYVPPIYLSEPDCREPKVGQESEPESQLITNPFTIKVEANPDPSIIVKPNILDESKLEVVAGLVPL